MGRAFVAALLAFSVWFLVSGASAASSAPLATAQLDLAGDGRLVSVGVCADGRVEVSHAIGSGEPLRLGADGLLISARIELRTTGTDGRYLWIESQTAEGHRQLLVAALVKGRLLVVYNGLVGPNSFGPGQTVDVAIERGALLRTRTDARFQRCDGDSRVSVERYSESGGWQPAPELMLASIPTSSLLNTTTDAPSDLPASPLGVYVYRPVWEPGKLHADAVARSAQAKDDNAGPVWSIAGDPRGAYGTASASGGQHGVRAIRIDAPPRQRGALPRQLALVLLGQPRQYLRVDLQPAARTQWVLLPQVIYTSCLSIVITEGAASSTSTAMGEIAVYSELDSTIELPELVEQVLAGPTNDSQLGYRTLQIRLSRQPVLAADVLDKAAALLPGAPLIDFWRAQWLLRLVADNGGSPERIAELLVRSLLPMPAASQPYALSSISNLRPIGRLVLARVAGDDRQTVALRMEALTMWGWFGRHEGAPGLVAMAAEMASSPLANRRAFWSALVRGFPSALHCLPRGDPTLTAAEQILFRFLDTTPVDEESSWRVNRAATLAPALASAVADCPDTGARDHLAQRLVAAWNAPVPTAKAVDRFPIRYRLLQGLAALAAPTPAIVAWLRQVLRDEPEPVLRREAAFT